MSNIEMHWYKRRPDEEDLRRYGSVRIMWTASNGKQQRAWINTFFVRLGDAAQDRDELAAEADQRKRDEKGRFV